MAKLSKDERVPQILQAAIDEFLEKGFASASMDRIAVRAGITKGGLYHHFRSKDHLLLEANKYFSGDLTEVITALVLSSDEAEGLSNFIESYLLYWASHRKELYFFSLSMTKTMEVEELSAFQTQSTNELIDVVTDVFQRGIDEGILKTHDCRSQAIAMLSALTGSLGYIYIKGLSH